MEVKAVVYTDKFERDVRKVRDSLMRERLAKLVERLAEDPSSGKPLRYGLKGEWTARVPPYRVIYALQDQKLILLRFEHRKTVYE